jgi:hypothetical protein
MQNITNTETVSFAGGVSAAAIEAGTSSKRPRPFPMDDNFLVPIGGGAVLTV